MDVLNFFSRKLHKNKFCVPPQPHLLTVYRGGWGVSAWGCLLHCMPGYTPSPVSRMTDRCKNTTLPQTSFAGGNERIWTPGGAHPWRPLGSANASRPRSLLVNIPNEGECTLTDHSRVFFFRCEVNSNLSN